MEGPSGMQRARTGVVLSRREALGASLADKVLQAGRREASGVRDNAATWAWAMASGDDRSKAKPALPELVLWLNKQDVGNRASDFTHGPRIAKYGNPNQSEAPESVPHVCGRGGTPSSSSRGRRCRCSPRPGAPG